MKFAKVIALFVGLWPLISCAKQDMTSAKAAPADPAAKVQAAKVVA